MNTERRKLLRGVITTIEDTVDAWETAFPACPEDECPDPSLEAIGGAWDTFTSELESAKTDLETARDEEQEYLDNMPEAFANGSKGDRAQEVIDYLEEAISYLESAIDALVEDAGERLTQIQDALSAAESAAE